MAVRRRDLCNDDHVGDFIQHDDALVVVVVVVVAVDQVRSVLAAGRDQLLQRVQLVWLQQWKS